MQDDLTDAVRWAVDEGIADRERIAIIGLSYGGYAAVAGAAFTPDLYKVRHRPVWQLQSVHDDQMVSAPYCNALPVECAGGKSR